MSNTKQSSVERLFEQVCNLDWCNISGEEKLKILEQAKAMHSEETLSLYYEYERHILLREGTVMTFRQFYNKTFGGNK